ncbi:hypothetical protein BV20DRAFT_1055439 [Pilatotrama ljubarskyi]|nr:hypothetical protein BV20DRAFT_1055439 [Pilatotrama ljubarskyi]
MSTYVNHAVAGSLPDIATRWRMEVSSKPGIAVSGGGERPTRRKADTMADGLDNEAEDELARSIKRCKRSDEDADQAGILQRLARLTVNAPAKKRGRAQGDAVKLRKRFIKSTRRLPAKPDYDGGAHYPFTFLPRPIPSTLTTSIDDICTPVGSPIEQASQVVIQEQKHEQVLVLVSSSQDVDPGASRQASASVSTYNMEMDADQLKNDHTPDGSTSSPNDDDYDDIDRLLASIDHTPASPSSNDDKNALRVPSVSSAAHVSTQANLDSFIPRFLARAAAAVRAPKPSIQPKPVVRVVAKSSKRARVAASVPYGRGRRPDRYTRRDEDTLMTSQGLFDPFSAITSPVLLQAAPVHEHQAMVTEDNAQTAPILDMSRPISDVEHERTVAEVIAAVASVPEHVKPLGSVEDGGVAASSTEDEVDDLFGDIPGASPASTAVDFCHTFGIEVREPSPTPCSPDHAVASLMQDDHIPLAYLEKTETSHTEVDAAHDVDADFDEWLASLQEPEEHQNIDALFGDASEVGRLCYTESPCLPPLSSDEDVFGEVLQAQVTTSQEQDVKVEDSPVPASASYEDLFGPEIEEFSTNVLPLGPAQELQDDEDIGECGEEQFYSLPPSPSPSSGQFLSMLAAKHDCDDRECAIFRLITQLDTESQVCSSLPPLCSDGGDSEDSSAYAPDIDEFCVGAARDSVAVDSPMWVFRESYVLPDLEENNDVVVVVPSEEDFESGIVLAADPSFGPLVAQLDKWSMKDAPVSLFTSPDPVSVSPMDADVWYDALDDEEFTSPAMSPAVSQGDLRMLCDDASPCVDMDDIFNDYARSAAPFSLAHTATGFFLGLCSTPATPTPGALPGDFERSMLDSPLQPLRWESLFSGSSGPLFSADTPQLVDDDSMDMDVDTDHSAVSSQHFAHHFGAPSGIPYRGTLLTCGASAPLGATCSFRLFEDDLAQPMLQDAAPSRDGLVDFAVSRVAYIPEAARARALPGAWLESSDSADDFFLN